MKYILFLLLLMSAVSAHLGEEPALEAEAHTNQSTCYPADGVVHEANAWVVLLLVTGLGLAALSVYQRSALVAVFAAVCLIAGLGYEFYLLEINAQSIHFGAAGGAHMHADFAVVINNQLVDFTNEHYMTFIGQERSRYVHLHDPDSVVHVHASNVTWKYFFETLDLPMNDSCIDVKGTQVCDAVFLVNNQPIQSLNTQIREGDRALFHYGAGNATVLFEQAVGNNSCLHSGTCPERGFIPGCGVPA